MRQARCDNDRQLQCCFEEFCHSAFARIDAQIVRLDAQLQCAVSSLQTNVAYWVQQHMDVERKRCRKLGMHRDALALPTVDEEDTPSVQCLQSDMALQLARCRADVSVLQEQVEANQIHLMAAHDLIADVRRDLSAHLELQHTFEPATMLADLREELGSVQMTQMKALMSHRQELAALVEAKHASLKEKLAQEIHIICNDLARTHFHSDRRISEPCTVGFSNGWHDLCISSRRKQQVEGSDVTPPPQGHDDGICHGNALSSGDSHICLAARNEGTRRREPSRASQMEVSGALGATFPSGGIGGQPGDAPHGRGPSSTVDGVISLKSHIRARIHDVDKEIAASAESRRDLLAEQEVHTQSCSEPAPSRSSQAKAMLPPDTSGEDSVGEDNEVLKEAMCYVNSPGRSAKRGSQGFVVLKSAAQELHCRSLELASSSVGKLHAVEGKVTGPVLTARGEAAAPPVGLGPRGGLPRRSAPEAPAATPPGPRAGAAGSRPAAPAAPSHEAREAQAAAVAYPRFQRVAPQQPPQAALCENEARRAHTWNGQLDGSALQRQRDGAAQGRCLSADACRGAASQLRHPSPMQQPQFVQLRAALAGHPAPQQASPCRALGAEFYYQASPRGVQPLPPSTLHGGFPSAAFAAAPGALLAPLPGAPLSARPAPAGRPAAGVLLLDPRDPRVPRSRSLGAAPRAPVLLGRQALPGELAAHL